MGFYQGGENGRVFEIRGVKKLNKIPYPGAGYEKGGDANGLIRRNL